MGLPGIQSSSLDTIGGTPLVRLSRVVPEGAANVLVKVEGATPPAATRTGWLWP